MQDVIVSLNGNVVKVTTLHNNEFKNAVKEISKEVVSDSKILDIEAFSNILSEQLHNVVSSKKSKYRLNFVVEPEDMSYRFVTVNKSNGDVEQKIIEEVKSKLTDVNLDEMYFSYMKIAPFVYQFVGTDKKHLDSFLEVCMKIGVELHSVLPWVMLLPKYVGTNSSAIFVCHIGTNPVVVLSELGGVFFVGSYDETESPDKLNKLVQELSIYKRAKPIDKVYTFNYPHLQSVEGLEIHPVDIPNADPKDTNGFDANLLANYMLDLAPDTIESQANLLNSLPLPVVKSSSLSLTKVAAPAAAVMAALLIFGGFIFFAKGNKSLMQGDTQVLGDKNNENSQQVANTETTPTPTPSPTVKDLDRKDLVVRIENGSGSTGIAAKTQANLEKLGYKVLEIDTAAETRDSTLFKFKNSKIDFKDLIQKDTTEYFPNVVVEEGIDTSNEYDLLIIVGTTQEL